MKIIKGYYSFIIIILVVVGFISILLLSKSNLNVLSVFIDNVRIQNSREVTQDGISFGSGEDNIFIDFIPEKGCIIFPDDSLHLAENVICLINDNLLNSYPLKKNDTICVIDSSEKVLLTFKKNKIWEKDKELQELKVRGWRGAIYPLSNIKEFKTKIHSFIYFDDGSPKIAILDNKDKLIVYQKNKQKYFKEDHFYIPLENTNKLQFRKIFERYVSYVERKTEKLIAEKRVFKISSIKKDFEINVNSKGFNINFLKPIKQNIRLDDILHLRSNSVVLTFGSLSHYGFNILIPKFVGKISDLAVRLDFKSYLQEKKILVMDPHIRQSEKSTYLIPYGKLTIFEEDTEIDIWIIKLTLPWNFIIYYLSVLVLFGIIYFPLYKNLFDEQGLKQFNQLLLLLSISLIFLSFRLLFSFKAFIQYPFRVDFYRDAIFGFIFVPILILEFSENQSSFWKTFLRAAILLVPCSVYLFKLSQLSTEILGIEIFKGKLFGLAIIMLIFYPIKMVVYKFFEFFGRISFSWQTSVIALIFILLIRLIFIKEAIFGIRASFLANLIAIGFLFGFLRNYFNHNIFDRINSLKILAFAFFFFLINSRFSGDYGYIIYFLSIPFVFIYLGLLSNENTTQKVCISNGVILLIFLIVGIFYIGNIMLYMADLERVGLLATYETRLLGFTDFSLLKAQGYRITEIFTEFFEKIKFYASSGLLGRSYLHSPLGAESNWFNDNVPSAFLMSEFGLIGVLIVFCAYSFILAVIIPGYNSVFLPSGTRYKIIDWKLVGVIAACLLIFPSIYMIFANVGLVPFTGKNVFLFGLDSYSDLMESGILFGLIAKGITIKNY